MQSLPLPSQLTVLHLMSIENSNFLLLFPIELLAKQKSNFEKLTCAAISLIRLSAASPRFDLDKNLKTQKKRQGRKIFIEAKFIFIIEQLG